MRNVLERPATIELLFDSDIAQRAHDEWGCNCGPGALACVLGKMPNDIRAACESVGFADRRYMSPTMMANAIPLAGGRISSRLIHNATAPRQHRWPTKGLCRIQWTGPWTQPGANPKWAYRQTHWIAAWNDSEPLIFDINGGAMRLGEWQQTIVPAITETIPRADGGWFITHSWEIQSQ